MQFPQDLSGRHRIAILMADPSWRTAPFGDPTWALFAHACLSNIVDDPSQIASWFDLHRPEIWRQKKSWHPDYQHWLAHQSTSIFMQAEYPEVPASRPYPFAGIRQLFPSAPFAGTLDWMIAFALSLGATELGIYGVEYQSPHERLYQRFGTAYWVGMARGMGVPVTLPPGCRLLDNILPGEYGPDFPPWPPGHHPNDWLTQDWIMDRIASEAFP